jgi:hypothetical protein
MMSDAVIIAGIVAFDIFAAFVFFVVLFREDIHQHFVGDLPNVGSLPVDTGTLSASEISVLENSSEGWHKDRVGNLYSFASNLTAAWLRSSDADPEHLRESIRHCIWHATQLSFGEGVENHLTNLCNIIDSYTPEDWNDHAQRSVIESELASIWAATRYIVRGNEFPFVPVDEQQTNS